MPGAKRAEPTPRTVYTQTKNGLPAREAVESRKALRGFSTPVTAVPNPVAVMTPPIAFFYPTDVIDDGRRVDADGTATGEGRGLSASDEHAKGGGGEQELTHEHS